MSSPLLLIAPLLLINCVIGVAACQAASSNSRPNIVLIMSDDQGMADVGCYGSEIPTPHLDQLGRDGIRFLNWYSASSICTPSRFGLLTGRNPCRSQDQLMSALMFQAEIDQNRGLRPGETTVAGLLRDAGYTTALIGKWHLGHGKQEFLPVFHGFETFKGHTGGCIDYFTMTYGVIPDWYEGTQHVARNGYATELITDEAISYLETHQNSEEPFFLYLPFNAPHFAKGWSPADSKTVNLMQAQAAELKRVEFIEEKVRREFAAMVVSLDDGIGRILQTLDELKLADNTVVIFLTDHGGDPVYGGNNRPWRGDKATLFDGGLRVPCLMRWAGHWPAGTVSTELTTSLDLLPTLCELAGADSQSVQPDGISLVNHLTTGVDLPERELFWRTGQHAELERGTWTALRAGSDKYVQDGTGVEYLFNLADDALEQHDLSL
ncbi:MAG: sulfatase-like hydrolase/transferase, partial [Planctomycetaceae bacterium]|nr:sulfatase-like hydrolase/transferase [Planctomycetaceae bacterium]